MLEKLSDDSERLQQDYVPGATKDKRVTDGIEAWISSSSDDSCFSRARTKRETKLYKPEESRYNERIKHWAGMWCRSRYHSMKNE